MPACIRSVPEKAPPRGGASEAFAALLAYAVLTIALTWPLARGLARDVVGDFGDPILNCWILAWDADHLLRAVEGHVSALAGYFHANIFYPHRYALAYSEHLTPQAFLILPVWAISKNALLCYNVLLLSTFTLSGLGMFLFARELTANRTAAFIAGLAYAFTPYRFGSITHIQVLSSMWMPFVLLGLRRFFITRRAAPLAGAAAAWIAQNLSCAYYLLFFSPVVALYAAWELTTRRLWGDWSTLRRLLLAGAAVVLATVPFLAPYFALRRLGFNPRSVAETDQFAADVYSYLTADAHLRLWGGVLRSFPKGEGSLFPGLTILLLAVIGIWACKGIRGSEFGIKNSELGIWERITGWTVWLACGLVAIVLFGWSLQFNHPRIESLRAALLLVFTLALVSLAVSPSRRVRLREWLSSPVGALTLILLFAVAMSLGPRIRSHGRLLEDTGLYALFYDYVPGFDGLRVPARFDMIVALALAALAAYGAVALMRLRGGSYMAAAVSALIVVESVAVPLDLNDNWLGYRQPYLAPMPAFVSTGKSTPPVYRFVAHLPPSATLLELPLGEIVCDARYMFYSTTHWRPLVNGYSGGAPEDYAPLSDKLQDVFDHPGVAWEAIASSAATHVIVHEAVYLDRRGAEVSEWLRAHGAQEVFRFGTDHVFELSQ